MREDFESTLLIEDGVPKLSEDFKKCLVKMKKPNHAKQEDITYNIETKKNLCNELYIPLILVALPQQ